MTELTPRQRILRAIKGEAVDRVPFCPFLAYYFEALDPKIQERGQLAYLEDMGADPLIRGAGFAWKKKSTRCEQKIEVKGNKRYTTLSTPYGELKTEHTYVEKGNTWFQSSYPVKTLEDMKALQAYFEDLIIEPAIDEWNQNEQAVGERALLLPLVGVDMKSSLQTLVENWMGTEQAAYMLFDYPDEMEELLAVMRQKSMRTVEYTVQSGAAAALFWEDSSTTNVSPALYEQYVEPEITAWAKVLQQSGKLLLHHACGLIHDLLPLMGRQGIAAVESLTPPPHGQCDCERSI